MDGVLITTIAKEDGMMITDFDDFSLWVYTIVDDICQSLQPALRRPGPAPICSDSEVLAMAIIGECRGWELETDVLSQWADHRTLFPHRPSQSRFNRRRRNLMAVFNLIRCAIRRVLDVAQESKTVIDSLPIPVVGFHLAPAARGDWAAHGARYGWCASKKETIYGYKLHLLVTAGGVILDFELAPANETDLAVGAELLAAHTDLTVVGDKGYVSEPVASVVWAENRVVLLAERRQNQHAQLPTSLRRAMTRVRQIVETVNDQLTEQFNIEKNHAHSFWGLCTRLMTKLTAHTLCIHLNRLLGNVDFLQIKQLAFPN